MLLIMKKKVILESYKILVQTIVPTEFTLLEVKIRSVVYMVLCFCFRLFSSP